MNSLNAISARISPPASPAPTRSNSISTISFTVTSADGDDKEPGDSDLGDARAFAPENPEPLTSNVDSDPFVLSKPEQRRNGATNTKERDGNPSESTPLFSTGSASKEKEMGARSSTWHRIPRRVVNSLVDSLRWILTTFVSTPSYYLIAWLYDENGNFDPLLQLRRLFGGSSGSARKQPLDYLVDGTNDLDEKSGNGELAPEGRRFPSGSSSSGISSESESDFDRTPARSEKLHTSSRHNRSKSLSPSEEIAPARRSIRIKLHTEDAMRQRKHRKTQSTNSPSTAGGSPGGARSNDISAQLKSPTSPAGALTRYPKTPAPPRPLVPRRQPSYINIPEMADRKHLKTLILDLDETLIHSMSKGGRMSSGHMVEVRLNTTYVGMGGQASIGPQHPILYYVHKRPHCDHFLRRVYKWFNLVVFTASVQEYADPVIDWLESERKFFSARYYRQHCTFRHGAFIKDLSSVEPDLSKVVILDNSPLSYLFHQDNAIPIQGWINDPTDNDLLNLVPFLEGLQYVSDVRALLALRGGEDGQHMA
ncbi:hypothetical protein PspLS_02923 [Pyricularia sp. CBS 133598]|nr:hypothetical protein PspLS_02923 [Pyricularia sp. CBS 133598]